MKTTLIEKNRLLHLAALTCTGLGFLAKVYLVLITCMVIYWHVNPALYDFIAIPQPASDSSLQLQATSLSITFAKSELAAVTSNSVVEVPSIKYDTVYLLYLQLAGLAIIWVLILREIQRILASVGELQTFRNSNEGAFRKIGLYCFCIFLVSSFEWLHTDTAYLFALHLDAVPLLFMLMSLLLAQIFSEGNKLYEAEQLTI